MSIKNERITENIIRDTLRDLGYWDEEADINVEEQRSQVEEISRLLKGASKTGKGGKGSPEFIISSRMYPDFLIVIECKATVKQHESSKRDCPVDYAVDGII